MGNKTIYKGIVAYFAVGASVLLLLFASFRLFGSRFGDSVIATFVIGVPLGLLFLLIWLIIWLLKGKEAERPLLSPFVGLWIVVGMIFVWIPNCAPLFRRGHPSQYEAKLHLRAIWDAQISYYENHLEFTESLKVLDWNPEGKSWFAYSCGSDIIQNTKGEPVPGTAFWAADIGASATGFTCAAVGNIDNDLDLDVWIINDAKQLVNEPSDL